MADEVKNLPSLDDEGELEIPGGMFAVNPVSKDLLGTKEVEAAAEAAIKAAEPKSESAAPVVAEPPAVTDEDFTAAREYLVGEGVPETLLNDSARDAIVDWAATQADKQETQVSEMSAMLEKFNAQMATAPVAPVAPHSVAPPAAGVTDLDLTTEEMVEAWGDKGAKAWRYQMELQDKRETRIQAHEKAMLLMGNQLEQTAIRAFVAENKDKYPALDTKEGLQSMIDKAGTLSKTNDYQTYDDVFADAVKLALPDDGSGKQAARRRRLAALKTKGQATTPVEATAPLKLTAEQIEDQVALLVTQGEEGRAEAERLGEQYRAGNRGIL